MANALTLKLYYLKQNRCFTFNVFRNAFLKSTGNLSEANALTLALYSLKKIDVQCLMCVEMQFEGQEEIRSSINLFKNTKTIKYCK